MGFLPVIRSRELVTALIKAGFYEARKVGSHVRLIHSQDHNRQTTVPIHPGTLPKWLVREILRQAGLSAKDLKRLLGN